MGVDSPRDIYLASRAMREAQGLPKSLGFTKQDRLNALYVGIGALPLLPFYDPMWAAMESEILQLEEELTPLSESGQRQLPDRTL